MKFLFFSFFLLIAFIFPSSAQAATGLPSGFTETKYISNVDQPTTIEFSPDGRLFIAEKTGNLRVFKNGQLLEDPFVSIDVTSNSERGLLGIAFDPNFATNRYVYVYYTRTNIPIKNRVSRFTASASNPDVAETGSEVVILDDIASDAGNHNGGDIHFGSDGTLYIATGDGGSTSQNSQDITNLNGKILRVNPDGSVPSDNPFLHISNARHEVWAYGLRNPFRFSIHPQSGLMYINDVGQSSREEINFGAKGANYGWPSCEGNCSNPNFLNPIYSYPRTVGGSITGGVFYTGQQFPQQYKDMYFFGDYVSNWIKYIHPTTRQVTDFANNTIGIVDLKVGPDGALYYASVIGNNVYRIAYTIASSPTPSPSSIPTNTPSPLPSVSPSPTACDADINQDGIVEIGDYSILVADFLKDDLSNPRSDMNHDGFADISDYSILVIYFFDTCN